MAALLPRSAQLAPALPIDWEWEPYIRIAWQVERLFESDGDPRNPRNWVDHTRWFMRWYSAGALGLRLFHIDRRFNRIGMKGRRFTDERYESARHKVMKAIGCAWLRDHCPDAQEEVRLHGFRFDVASWAGKAFVECGNTCINRLADIAQHHDDPRFYLIPFQRAAYQIEDGEARSLLAVEVVFRPGATRLIRETYSRERRAELALPPLTPAPLPAGAAA